MIRSTARASLILAVALAGCQGPAPADHVVAVAFDASADAAAEARAAMARGDWSSAARLLRAALVREPHSVELHYRLAITATHLDALDDARQEFEWVEAHAPAGSEPAGVARDWLASRSGGRPATAAAEPSGAASATGVGSLSGQVLWAEPGRGAQPPNRQLVMLIGLPGTPTKGHRYRVRSDENGRYLFKDVVAGPYQLTDAIAGQPTWRHRVVVEPGRDTVLDLSRGNAVPARDDFPAASGSAAAPSSPNAPAPTR